MMSTPVDTGALAGLRVLEYASFIAGPYCAKLLADLGAEVVKVEPPTGDPARRGGPFAGGIPEPERSGLFLYLNTNKLGVTLDLRTAMARNIFSRLAQEADVVVTDVPPDDAERLGLVPQDLRKLNPRLVVTTVRPFGWGGPYAAYKAYPLNVNHVSGEGFLMPGGLENLGRPPAKAGNYVSSYDGGLNAALGTLAAVWAREFTGEGQHVDVSEQESTLSIYHMAVTALTEEHHLYSRNTASPSAGGVLPCKDGYVELFMWFEEWEWPRLLELLGNPDWALDPRFKDQPSRAQNWEELFLLLLQWTVERTKEEIYQKAQALKVPIGVYSTAEDLVHSEQLKHRGFFQEVEHPVAGRFLYPTVAYKLSRTPWRAWRPAPMLGQHNQDVLSGRLGFSSKEDLVKLREGGVI